MEHDLPIDNYHRTNPVVAGQTRTWPVYVLEGVDVPAGCSPPYAVSPYVPQGDQLERLLLKEAARLALRTAGGSWVTCFRPRNSENDLVVYRINHFRDDDEVWLLIVCRLNTTIELDTRVLARQTGMYHLWSGNGYGPANPDGDPDAVNLSLESLLEVGRLTAGLRELAQHYQGIAPYCHVACFGGGTGCGSTAKEALEITKARVLAPFLEG